VSRKANDKHLAILFGGQVLSAPLMADPITTTSQVTLGVRDRNFVAKQIVVRLAFVGNPPAPTGRRTGAGVRKQEGFRGYILLQNSG
jgi:hypothetical protein